MGVLVADEILSDLVSNEPSLDEILLKRGSRYTLGILDGAGVRTTKDLPAVVIARIMDRGLPT